MSSEILLQATRLARRYGERVALDGLDLELRRGEVLGLLGPNGAGKSTTMRILSGTLPPNAGRVRINGLDLFEAPRRAKRHLGYLPELPPVYGDMRVSAYLRYCGRLHGVSGGKLQPAVESALGRCGLEEVAGRLIGRLSKGYQQRVGIAQAILHRPDLLILDEPTVGLDPLQIREIRALLRELRREHAIILSSHILPEIQALCDRVLILNRGRRVYEGPLDKTERGPREVLLTCREAPNPAVLGRVSGVESVEPVGGERLRIRLAEPAAGERVQQAVLAAGWGIEEWLPVRQNLEQLFVSLTHGDSAQKAAG